MADFSALKTSIQNYIKQNGNEEITGNLLQQILLSMVTTLGDSAINDLVTALNTEIANRGNADTTLQGNINSEATTRANVDTELGGRITTLQGVVNGIVANVENGYVYTGIATPSTTPVSGKVFYLALTAGTYTNFGATVVPQGINILKYNGSAWSLDSFLGLDDAPTQGSNNLVKSGGVLDSIIKDGSAFDLSAYNSGTTYADLSAALTALNALPAAYKKGGMSFKFLLTSDNKYIQARCMAQNFTTDVTQWQGVDEEPTAGSKNFIDSNAVYNIIPIGNILDYASRHINKVINGTYGYEVDSPTWDATTFIPLEPNTKYYCYGFYSKGFYGFYTAAQESAFVSSPDVTITTDGDYKCTIEIGSTSYYFRCSLSKDRGATAYISKYYDEYHEFNKPDYSCFTVKTNKRVLALEEQIPIGNILDASTRHLNKSINAQYGWEVDNNIWDATDYIELQSNTTYYGFGFYSKGFYAFYSKAEESAFVSSPDVVVTPNGDYNCTIAVGSSKIYFRGSLAKGYVATAYISEYYNDYSPYNEKDYSAFIGRTNNRVSALETKETMLGKKVLVIGDSISTDDLSYTYFRNHSSIYPEYQNYNNYGYYNKWVIDLVNEKFLPTDVDNNSIHATGFVRHLGDYDNDFVTRLKNIDNPSQYDLVIIFGGINDFIGNIPLGESGQDYNTYFKPAVDEFFNFLINNFTQARLCVLLPLRTDNLYPNTQGVKQEVYDEYIKEVAESYCLPILNLTKESGFFPWNTTFKAMWTFHGQNDEYPQGDGVHPNANYQLKYLSQQIKGFIKELL